MGLVTIHVFDEQRGVGRDFQVEAKVLLNKMR